MHMTSNGSLIGKYRALSFPGFEHRSSCFTWCSSQQTWYCLTLKSVNNQLIKDGRIKP
uniref:Uncharacterized protein n=1 Tax=Anguilla anguilla TaxID=7936 RepID=A0A0E9W0K5_ANGAN